MRTLTRRRLLGAAAAAGAAALAGCGRPGGAARRPWEGEPASTEGLWGFVDASGSWALPPRWHEARGFEGGLATVQYGDEGSATGDDPPLVGLIGDDGEMAFDPIVGDFGGGLSQGAFAVDTDWEGYSRNLVFYGTDGHRIAPAGGGVRAGALLPTGRRPVRRDLRPRPPVAWRLGRALAGRLVAHGPEVQGRPHGWVR